MVARSMSANNAVYIWALLRIMFGLTFVWAFVDKLFGLGFATESDGKWLDGNAVTFGFLNFGASGPLQSMYQSMAGNPIVEWLFMLGLLGVGISFTIGAGMKLGAISGALLYALMWSVALPPEHHPFLDEHLIGGVAMLGLAMVGAGSTWGVGSWWTGTSIVKNMPILE